MDQFGSHPWSRLHVRSGRPTYGGEPSHRMQHSQRHWPGLLPFDVPLHSAVDSPGNHSATPPFRRSPQHTQRSAGSLGIIESSDGVGAEYERAKDDQDEYVDSPGEDMDTDAPPVAADAAHASARSRYLRETDRRAIIQRIHNGEKQAELAREFGVTRAAICHINKNRAEILARSTRPDVHAAARHPKRRMSTVAIALRQRTRQSQHQQQSLELEPAKTDQAVCNLPPTVHWVRSYALAIHMATLQRQETPSSEFRMITNRAIWILIEEALALAPTRSVNVLASNASVVRGVASQHPTCVVVMGECGYPMLEAFRAIQPDSSTGFMTLDCGRDVHSGSPRGPVTLRQLCAPADLRNHAIFLLDATCTNALKAMAAIQSLVDLGVLESSIFFVTLEIREATVAEIYERFPDVHVVTASVGSQTHLGVGNFVERYFNTTAIHRSELGSTVGV